MEIKLTTQMPARSDDGRPDTDPAKALTDMILAVLDEHSAQDTITIDIKGKSSVADMMIVTCGRSNRHVSALAGYVVAAMKENDHAPLGVEGQIGNDWVLVDGGDIIIHIFRPEVRAFYNLEKIWSVPLPDAVQQAGESTYAPE